jgi:AcrR family transcriptional regulator
VDGRRARKDTNRKRLIDAAFTLFREGGEEALTMRRLAAEAGVSEATPYNVFKSKTGVLVAMFQAFLDQLHGKHDPDHRQLNALEHLLAVTERVANLWSEPTGLFCKLMIAIRKSGESPPELIDRPMHGITGAVMRLQDEGWLTSAIPAEIVAARIAHSNAGLFGVWLTGHFSREQLQTELKLNALLPILAASSGDRREDIFKILQATSCSPTHNSAKPPASQ